VGTSRTSKVGLWLLGAGLPLAMGVLGLLALVVDLFGPFKLPKSYGDEVLLAAASVVLLAYFALHQHQRGFDARHTQLLASIHRWAWR